MLFTSASSPPYSSSSSSSASPEDLSPFGSNDSSPIHLSSFASRSLRYVDRPSPLITTNCDERLASPVLTHRSVSSDQECFYSPLSSISSSRPSISGTANNFCSRPTTRRVSSPISLPIQKKVKRFRFPTFTRHASMMSNSESDSYPQNTAVAINLRPASVPIPVANPAAVAALVDEDEPIVAKSLSPSPSLTPKNSINQRRLPGQTLASLYPLNSRKVLLNVGGVRHEGNRKTSFPNVFKRRFFFLSSLQFFGEHFLVYQILDLDV